MRYHICTFSRGSNQRMSFRIHSWVDLPQVYEHSSYLVLHFRHYRNFFCLPSTLSMFAFGMFLILGTSHPGTLQWMPRRDL